MQTTPDVYKHIHIEVQQMNFMNIKDVSARIRLGRSTIYKLISEGRFPKQVPVLGGSVVWVESEVLEWMEEKVALRDLQGGGVKP